MIAWLLLFACKGAVAPDYWPGEAPGPELLGLLPSSAPGLVGGDSIVLTGVNLETAQTVVFGGRNGRILDTTDGAVTVELPAGPAGGGSVAVSVVTDDGQTTLEDGFTYTTPAMEFLEDEVASVAITRLDCPIMAYTLWLDDLDWYPLYWCGMEMGEFWSEGWWGSGGGRGMAGDLSGMGQMSGLPARGGVKVWGPGEARPGGPPEMYGSHTADESIRIATARDFSWDLSFVANRVAEVERTYPWIDDVQSIDSPLLALFDDEGWLGDVPVTGGTGQVIQVEGSVEGATAGWLGFTVTELYGNETYVEEAWVGSAQLVPGSGGLVGSTAGVDLAYDEYSGRFYGTGNAGLEGLSSVVPGVPYDVTVQRGGLTLAQDRIDGPGEFLLLAPDLMMGDVDVDMEQAVLVQWEAGSDAAGPSIVVVELRIYDAGLDDPTWMTELYRLVAWSDDSAGRIQLASDAFDRLPMAANATDTNDEMVGYWGELTVVRHQLRKINVEGGSLVVDFVHSVGSPVTLSRNGAWQ
jgi:hypothetical protein